MQEIVLTTVKIVVNFVEDDNIDRDEHKQENDWDYAWATLGMGTVDIERAGKVIKQQLADLEEIRAATKNSQRTSTGAATGKE